MRNYKNRQIFVKNFILRADEGLNGFENVESIIKSLLFFYNLHPTS